MKIVVAYSGGLDTSVLLLWLKAKYNAEIIAYCADVGQGDELDGLEAKALSTGASKCFIGDLKEDFAANYIFPMIQAGAIYEGRYLLGTSIARPCITHDMIKVALAEGEMPSPTEPPARATTKSASSFPPPPSRPTSSASPHGATPSSARNSPVAPK